MKKLWRLILSLINKIMGKRFSQYSVSNQPLSGNELVLLSQGGSTVYIPSSAFATSQSYLANGSVITVDQDITSDDLGKFHTITATCTLTFPVVDSSNYGKKIGFIVTSGTTTFAGASVFGQTGGSIDEISIYNGIVTLESTAAGWVANTELALNDCSLSGELLVPNALTTDATAKTNLRNALGLGTSATTDTIEVEVLGGTLTPNELDNGNFIRGGSNLIILNNPPLNITSSGPAENDIQFTIEGPATISLVSDTTYDGILPFSEITDLTLIASEFMEFTWDVSTTTWSVEPTTTINGKVPIYNYTQAVMQFIALSGNPGSEVIFVSDTI